MKKSILVLALIFGAVPALADILVPGAVPIPSDQSKALYARILHVTKQTPAVDHAGNSKVAGYASVSCKQNHSTDEYACQVFIENK
jgi:hypothetical protein